MKPNINSGMLRTYLHRNGKIPTTIHPFEKAKLGDTSYIAPQVRLRDRITSSIKSAISIYILRERSKPK